MAQGDAEDVVHRENMEMLMEIARMCRRPDRKYPETLLLIGTVGCGKSSMINTIFKAITGEYKMKAAVGAGGDAQSRTLYLQRYASCGVATDDFIKEFNKDCFRNCLPKLPTILDAAGLGDVNTPELQEILELLIGGYIPTGISIESLDKLQADNFPGVLRLVYNKVYHENRVSKIVFVQSCLASVPKNLISCLQKAIRAVDPTTMQMKYTGEIYVAITKYDMVKEENKYAHEMHNISETVALEDFKAVEQQVANSLNILEALEFNRIRWISYTDRVGFDDNPHINNIALKFLRRMLQCSASPMDVVKPVITHQLRAKLKVKQLERAVGQFISCKFIFCSIIFLFVAFVVFKLLMAPPLSGRK